MPLRKVTNGQQSAFTPVDLSNAEQAELLAERWELIAASLSPHVMIPAREVAETLGACVRTMGLISQVAGAPLECQAVLRSWREATARLEQTLAAQSSGAQ
jgi:hypothetical protein